jgi:hypothetical protein
MTGGGGGSTVPIDPHSPPVENTWQEDPPTMRINPAIYGQVAAGGTATTRAFTAAREYAPPTHADLARHHPEHPYLEGISDIKIIGIDEKRPPRVRKEPYIDLFFMLSHKPPKKWCEDFNKLVKDLVPPVKINENEGIFIDAYVRDMSHIPAHLDKIKKKITTCNEQYIQSIRQRELDEATRNTSHFGASGEQGKLNAIVAALKFDD